MFKSGYPGCLDSVIGPKEDYEYILFTKTIIIHIMFDSFTVKQQMKLSRLVTYLNILFEVFQQY